nr:NADP-dependent oxidoreductase [Mammaliicoccus sp. Marseille-Q6498]
MQNEQIVLAKRAEGIPEDETFRFEKIEVTEPSNDEVLLQSIYISVDPYMRGRMSSGKSYVQPYELDKPLAGHIVAKVVKSNADELNEGDVVTGVLPWQRYITTNAKAVSKIASDEVPSYLYLSVLGMPGMTAYQGLLQIGKPQEGETVVVSAASGAVGSVVGQIAKIKGAHVVGIAGGPEKVNYLTETLGFDEGIDYKDSQFAEKLEKAVPNGIDVYFENVGGSISDEVFKYLNKFARVPVCGSISAYNNPEEDIGPRIQQVLIKSQALMQGFIVAQFEDDFKPAAEQLAKWVSEDKIKSEVTIDQGFDQIPNAFRKLFTGDNFGKQVIQIAEI